MRPRWPEGGNRPISSDYSTTNRPIVIVSRSAGARDSPWAHNQERNSDNAEQAPFRQRSKQALQ